jgi:osmotically inducible protein OsmC
MSRLLNVMHVPEDIARTATVEWTGDVSHGHGSIKTGSGKIEADYSFGTRFSGEPGTNPEELLGASLAACFTMALAATLTRSGHATTSIDTTAKVHLKQVVGGFEIAQIELTTHAVVPGILDDEFQSFALQAKESCPIGKALHTVPIALKASRKQ